MTYRRVVNNIAAVEDNDWDSLRYVLSQLNRDGVSLGETQVQNNLSLETTIAGLHTVHDFLELTDTPTTFAGASLQYPRVNVGETALEFVNPTFLELDDAPSSYAGASLQSVRVNAGETGLEFAAFPVETLQDAYDAATTDPQITVLAGDPLVIDAATPVQSILRLRNSSSVSVVDVTDIGAAMSKPLVFATDGSTAYSAYTVSDLSAQAFTAPFVGGTFGDLRTITFTNPLFVYETLRAGPDIQSLVAPSFAAFTLFNVLPRLRCGPIAGQNALPALVLNSGPVMQNEFATAQTLTLTPATVNAVMQLKTTVSGASLTAGNMTGLLFSPAFSTVSGSTINFGILRGLRCASPTAGLFQPQAGAEGMTAYFGVDVAAIPFGGNVPKAAVRSNIAAASNAYFLYNLGTAQSYFNNAAILQIGELRWGADTSITRIAANLISMGTGDSFRISTGRLYFGASGAVNLSSSVADRLDLASGDSLRIVNGALEHLAGTVGWYGVAPVAQDADIVALTDSTGGTPNNTLVAISGTGDDANINDNFADLAAKVNAIRTHLRRDGRMA